MSLLSLVTNKLSAQIGPDSNIFKQVLWKYEPFLSNDKSTSPNILTKSLLFVIYVGLLTGPFLEKPGTRLTSSIFCSFQPPGYVIIYVYDIENKNWVKEETNPTMYFVMKHKFVAIREQINNNPSEQNKVLQKRKESDSSKKSVNDGKKKRTDSGEK